jgi:hypothetical protein
VHNTTTTWVRCRDLGPYPSLRPAGNTDQSTSATFDLTTARRFAADTARLAVLSVNATPVLREDPDTGTFFVTGDTARHTPGTHHIQARSDGTVTIGDPWTWQECQVSELDGALTRCYTLSVTVIGPYSPADTADLLYNAVATAADGAHIVSATLDYNDSDQITLTCYRRLPGGLSCARRPGHSGDYDSHPDIAPHRAVNANT